MTDPHRPAPAPKEPGPKEKEIAAALTSATVALAANGSYATLDAAGDAVAMVYRRMFDVVVSGARPQRRP